ncbi:MAG: hypothetical protein WDA70_06850 [Lysobacteraceae bacterium]|uniref:class I SAM-dependent methyltransferase n=1 Tax=Denitratimonas sp. CY0512 TaxID=3131940 RepID=UPI0016A378B8|nr:class I SAM-dependent methyltransferase [Gammaproteobacteria bacterium]
MPAAPTSRQPESPPSWFDSGRGSAMLNAEHALLMPMIVRATGSNSCLVLPSAAAAECAPATLMRNEVRMWCDARGWHRAGREEGVDSPLPLARSIDLLLASHVLSASEDAALRMSEIARLMVPGGVVLIVEFSPYSPYRWHWHGHVPAPLPLSRCTELAAAAGLEVTATYALSPGISQQRPGLLARRGWRPMSWLPLPAYVVRARKHAAGLTPVGPIVPVGFSLEYPQA